MRIAVRIILFALLVYIIISAFMELGSWKKYNAKKTVTPSEVSGK